MAWHCRRCKQNQWERKSKTYWRCIKCGTFTGTVTSREAGKALAGVIHQIKADARCQERTERKQARVQQRRSRFKIVEAK